jgi:hypothetical protein
LCFLLLALPPCCLGLSQGHSGLTEDGKTPNPGAGITPSTSPSTSVSSEALPPSPGALLFMPRTDHLPREDQAIPTVPPSGRFPASGHCLSFYTKYNVPALPVIPTGHPWMVSREVFFQSGSIILREILFPYSWSPS